MTARAFMLIVFAYSLTNAQAAISIVYPVSRQVFQRGANNTASVLIRGACSTTIDSIQARLLPMDGSTGVGHGWKAIQYGSGGGSYRGSLVVPAGGWYHLDVRGMVGGVSAETSRVSRIGVGEVFVVAGQSNAANWGETAQSAQDDRLSQFSFAGGWKLLSDTQSGANGTAGSCWPAFGDDLIDDINVPIAVADVAYGGSSVGEWQSGGTHYARLQNIASWIATNGGARAVLWHQGESDSLAGTSRLTYSNRLADVISATRTAYGSSIPWGVATASYHPSASAANQQAVANAQSDVVAADPLVWQGAVTDGYAAKNWLHDTVHFKVAGLGDHGRQWSTNVQSNVTWPVTPPTIHARGLILSMY